MKRAVIDLLTGKTTYVEIDDMQALKPTNEQQTELRNIAYREESDPIFFKYQRDQATKQEWLDKIAEIQLRIPYYYPDTSI